MKKKYKFSHSFIGGNNLHYKWDQVSENGSIIGGMVVQAHLFWSGGKELLNADGTVEKLV